MFGANTRELTILRQFRDKVLSKSVFGRQVIEVYYDNSEAIEAYLKNNPAASDYAGKMIRSVVTIIEKIL